MAKVKFFCDSGASIESCRESGVLDTVDDLGMDEGEWEGMDEDARFEVARDWAEERLEIGFREVEP